MSFLHCTFRVTQETWVPTVEDQALIETLFPTLWDRNYDMGSARVMRASEITVMKNQKYGKRIKSVPPPTGRTSAV